jgi:hypothetical protein
MADDNSTKKDGAPDGLKFTNVHSGDYSTQILMSTKQQSMEYSDVSSGAHTLQMAGVFSDATAQRFADRKYQLPTVEDVREQRMARFNTNGRQLGTSEESTNTSDMTARR